MRIVLRGLFSLCVALGIARADDDAGSETQARLPVLYIFAHQDDEVFILTKMARDVERGREVHAVWITDGGRRGSGERRTEESRAVMMLIGVPAERLHFLGFPDQGAVEHLPAIREQVRAIFAAEPFAEITTPAYEGGNIDHDVAALIGAFLVRHAGGWPTHFEYPLYNHFNGRSRVGEFLPNSDSPLLSSTLSPADCRLIRKAVRLHRSQRWLLVALRLGMDRRALRDRGEPYRVAPAYDFLERPAGQPCRYEVTRRHRSRFDRWLGAVQPFLASDSSDGEEAAFEDVALMSDSFDAVPH